MRIKAEILIAFGKTNEGGNLAGVVSNAEKLSRDQKLKIASILGFSETAFISNSSKADFKVEFFTPSDEVDMCGHATIATFSYLSLKGLIKKGNYQQETKAGILGIEIGDNNLVIMSQSLPEFLGEVKIENVLEILGCDELDLDLSIKPQIVSTGLKDIFVSIKDRKELNSISPNFELMKKFNKDTATIGFHIYTLDTISKDSIANCRNFAPLYDITEEAATGSSNGALACLLYKEGKLSKTKNLVLEQGYSMNKPSEIVADLEIKGSEITEIKVGGYAKLIETKILDI